MTYSSYFLPLDGGGIRWGVKCCKLTPPSQPSPTRGEGILSSETGAMHYHVYVIKSKQTGQHYIGMTNNTEVLIENGWR